MDIKILERIRYVIFVIFAFFITVFYILCIPFAFCSKKFARFISILWVDSLLFITRFIARIQIKVINNLPKKDGIIIVANHCSAWETFFIASQFKMPTFILKKSLFHIPLLGLFLNALDMIGIDRNSYSKGHREKIIKKADEELASGRNMAIFPQGTRVPIEQTYNYEKYPYKAGVTIFSKGHTVLTISTDSRKTFGKSLFSYKKSGVINVIFNEYLSLDERLSKNEMMEVVRNSIEKGCKKII